MGDVARCSLGKQGEAHSEELLYRLFGINAELLIDHAWGWEPCTIQDIKSYKPQTNSLCSGQVLRGPSSWDQARLVVKEMADQLALDLVEKGWLRIRSCLLWAMTGENLTDPLRRGAYGERSPPTGMAVLFQSMHTVPGIWISPPPQPESSGEAAAALFDRIADPGLLVRRLYGDSRTGRAGGKYKKEEVYEQLDLFTDYMALEQQRKKENEALEREKKNAAGYGGYSEKVWEKRYFKGNESGGRRYGQRTKPSDRRS